MEWISVEKELPIQQPENIPTYDWVIVTAKRDGTDEPWPFSIARYTDNGWEFWEEKLPECPCFGDTVDAMHTDEITHWMKLDKPEEAERWNGSVLKIGCP